MTAPVANDSGSDRAASFQSAAASTNESSMTSTPSSITQPSSDGRSPEKSASAPPTFADRLNRLFDTLKPPGRDFYTSGELVSSLNAMGVRISAPYVSQLRSGARTHPSATTIEAIAKFFRVHPGYFTDTAYYTAVDKELTMMSAMRDPGVRRVVTRAIGLSPSAIDEIVEAADGLRSHQFSRERAASEAAQG